MDESKRVEQQRRFLAPKARRGDGLGYTDVAELGMHGEPECLDEQQWRDHVGEPAKAVERQRRAAVAVDVSERLLSQEERIVKALGEAERIGRDVSREAWLLRRMQLKGRPREVERRLQVVERIVYLGRRAA